MDLVRLACVGREPPTFESSESSARVVHFADVQLSTLSVAGMEASAEKPRRHLLLTLLSVPASA